jgi:hypothetical protein
MNRKLDIDTAIFNPARFFKTPEEILQDSKITLSKEQKINALKTWMYDIQLRRVAEEENMRSEHDERDVKIEDEILQALAKLEPPPSSPRISPTKIGGF